jgi:hypothetical protein
VTLEAKIEEQVEVEVEVMDDVPSTTEDGDATAKLEEPVSEEKEEPEIPTILG